MFFVVYCSSLSSHFNFSTNPEKGAIETGRLVARVVTKQACPSLKVFGLILAAIGFAMLIPGVCGLHHILDITHMGSVALIAIGSAILLGAYVVCTDDGTTSIRL